jgi:glycosyltransferase involved in cell wall biosynthesis
MMVAAASIADVRVIVPVPWVPPLLPLPEIARFRRVPVTEQRGPVRLYHPRVVMPLDHHLNGVDARLSWRTVLRLTRALHRQEPIDLIHAHFIYPEGVVASLVGRALGIPVMTTEHALWSPWLLDRKRTGRQVQQALPDVRLVTAVSAFQRENLEAFAGDRVAIRVLPNVLDGTIFHPALGERNPNELLYVGLIRRVKRVDVLLQALALARRVHPALRLRIIASNAFRTYSRDLREVKRMVGALDLGAAVTFESGATPREVAAAMRRCAFVLVSSSRRETFCSVAAEALACGTPLVCTRCGGPEEFVGSDDGVLVEPDDVEAFADGLLRAIERRPTFDSGAMSARVTARFGQAAWIRQATALYRQVATGAILPG